MSHGKLSLLSLVVAASLGAGVPADAKTLKWANDGDVITADIHSRNEAFVFAVMSNVYEPLVQRNDKFELVPTLATEWKLMQPDTWRFTLRQGVKFTTAALSTPTTSSSRTIAQRGRAPTSAATSAR
jgi:peptide/nickel transport system substrate-binding protein